MNKIRGWIVDALFLMAAVPFVLIVSIAWIVDFFKMGKSNG